MLRSSLKIIVDLQLWKKIAVGRSETNFNLTFPADRSFILLDFFSFWLNTLLQQKRKLAFQLVFSCCCYTYHASPTTTISRDNSARLVISK